MPSYHSEQQFPSCFGAARLAGCTINIYQAPPVIETAAKAYYATVDVAGLFQVIGNVQDMYVQ